MELSLIRCTLCWIGNDRQPTILVVLNIMLLPSLIRFLFHGLDHILDDALACLCSFRCGLSVDPMAIAVVLNCPPPDAQDRNVLPIIFSLWPSAHLLIRWIEKPGPMLSNLVI
ncbi:hypothetical protein K469DRAFT_306006 [Zopfia rhizophila CBS 207.26]|uniref:Uncharacterized protein n=1 Tax=Zopfia rhizophila CBS 207.26 TaxID=1314779 RepID=A0A6A6EKH5_9PEZI|nr:hypothetical protein K469DRAFT_306006 [Zopfia rhizophila CBS 207.26]